MGSSLHQIIVPDGLAKQTYGELFRYLSQRGIIPLGLLRGIFPAMGIGPKGNKAPYVFTNPSKDTEVFSCDKVFVLSQKSLTTTKFTAEDIHDNFLKQNETAILTRKTEMDTEGDVKLRGKDAAIGRELDYYMKNMSGDLMVVINAVSELKAAGRKHKQDRDVGKTAAAPSAASAGRLSARGVPKPGQVRRALERQSTCSTSGKLKRGGSEKLLDSCRTSKVSVSDQSQQSSESPLLLRPETARSSPRTTKERRRSSSSTLSEIEPRYR